MSARSLSYAFPDGTVAVSGADLTLGLGETLALAGPSGSGKSTLLMLLAGILVPAEGVVDFDGESLSGASQDERARVRLTRFGFVFQSSDLVPELTLRENIELPLRLTGRSGAAGDEARDVASRLGIEELLDRHPAQVSGGQRQRAALARAVVHRPEVVFADEPTGALDRESGRRAMELLLALSAERGASLLVVTHDEKVAGMLSRRVVMSDGHVEE
ncbi:ABC transporter ATP-binding protein [Nocardioides mesophilus]|uniref:ABC transporter ATP-binding protein n=1 Tax=Nocardioides mesophilus TaxID=433659 RepID=A0A7G9RGW5_9ACTN|nr:ABC transporter ATP-binding protein [Nocardioides mesophilus]